MRKTAFLIAVGFLVVVGCQSSNDQGPSTTATNAQPNPTSQPTDSTKTTASGTGYTAVQAIFTQNCVGCHGGQKPKGGIDLTSYATVMKGGEEGPIVKAGDPANSVLIQALHGTNGKKQMPMKRPPLPADQIKTIEGWIQSGAKQS